MVIAYYGSTMLFKSDKIASQTPTPITRTSSSRFGMPMRYSLTRVVTIFVALIIVSTLSLPAYGYGLSASFLYKLSDFNGIVPFSGVKMFPDVVHNEVYVLDGGMIRIFNQAGMEVYRFNEDGSLGSLSSSVVDTEGNIIALAYDAKGYFLIRCNYRGDLTSRFELKNIPSAFQTGFTPSSLAYRKGHFYLADSGSMKIAVTDEQGLFERGIDLLDVAGFKQKNRGNFEMMGFSVDREGSILFTVPAEFCAYKLSPDGALASFCQRGSGPGKFNIAAGIVSDDSGYIYVSDKLKSSVLIFDNEFKFINQLGARGYGPFGFIVPMDMAVLGDKLYVAQGAGQGVSVFSITH
jgi:DNA-binding beta-propeller fold protein YncE